MCIITQARVTLTNCCINSNSPKPIIRVVSKSRSWVTKTLSRVHCSRNGLTSEKTSSANANSSTCANAR
ncbi:hypothetical protein D3C72_2033320 [compost metagenome]